MIIQELRIMRGPNMWSPDYQCVIAVKLDFTQYPTILSEDATQLATRVSASLGISVHGNTVMEVMTRALSMLASSLQGASRFHDARCLGTCSWYAVVGYQTEEAGIVAVQSAAEMLEAVMDDRLIPDAAAYRSRIHDIEEEAFPGPSTNAIIQAAKKRDIPVRHVAGGRYTIFGQGKYQRQLNASICWNTSNIAVDIASDKSTTKELLAAALVPVPEGHLVAEEHQLDSIAASLGFPLVAKPLDGNQGRYVTTGIQDIERLRHAFNVAKQHSDQVIIERHAEGDDYRVLVINYQVVAAARRKPASVIGDGVSSVKILVDRLNADPLRGDGHEKTLTKVRIDETALKVLKEQQLTVNDIPDAGSVVRLRDTANLSTGGTAEDVTDEVHPENILLAQKVAKIIGLNICGIDIMAPTLSTPIARNGGVILEVNAAPGLRMHLCPSSGKPRDVGTPIINMIYPPGAKTRIPIVGVTGTNGKTTTVRLMAYLAKKEGYHIGYTTSEGIYVNNLQISKGDCSGPASARVILQDPDVDFAVLECARGGIIRSGLAFDQCDIAIVTNIAEDHLGMKDINTLEDLAKVKGVLAEAVKPSGFAVLNACDDLVYEMRNRVRCNVALFSIEGKTPRIEEHIKNGRPAIILDKDNTIIILHYRQEIVVGNVVNIPITMEGKARFMIDNVLPVILAGWLYGFSLDNIRSSLSTFKPSAEQTPGRINQFKIEDKTVLVDYAHNAHGFRALGDFLKNIEGRKTGIITGTGDRRDQDIIELGRLAASMYDDVIIRMDKDTRGRTAEDICRLIVVGLEQIRPVPYRVIPETTDALRFALKSAAKNAHIVVHADDVFDTIEMMEKLTGEKIQTVESNGAG